jgi:hypothetical protein
LTLEFGKGPCLLPLTVAQDPRHSQRGVVVENPRRNAAKILEGSNMAFEESLGRRS